ncbi:hypothetical protein YC2023_072464 [Brassica napus]
MQTRLGYNKWSLIFTTMYWVEMSANDASDTAMFIASDRCTDCKKRKDQRDADFTSGSGSWFQPDNRESSFT